MFKQEKDMEGLVLAQEPEVTLDNLCTSLPAAEFVPVQRVSWYIG
jgi:hypothetical protein